VGGGGGGGGHPRSRRHFSRATRPSWSVHFFLFSFLVREKQIAYECVRKCTCVYVCENHVSRVCVYVCDSHVSHMKEACHTHEGLMSHI